MVLITNSVGRLVEVRPVAPIEPSDVEQFQRDMRSILDASLERRVVFTDLSQLNILAGARAEALIALMRTDNAQIERSALYQPCDKPSLNLQLERLVDAAGNRSRRLFHTAAGVEQWLGEVLNGAEKRRLQLAFSRILQEQMPTV